jgi:hypothetical protein
MRMRAEVSPGIVVRGFQGIPRRFAEAETGRSGWKPVSDAGETREREDEARESDGGGARRTRDGHSPGGHVRSRFADVRLEALATTRAPVPVARQEAPPLRESDVTAARQDHRSTAAVVLVFRTPPACAELRTSECNNF